MNSTTRLFSPWSRTAWSLTSLIIATTLTGCAAIGGEVSPHATAVIAEQQDSTNSPGQLPPSQSPNTSHQLPGVGPAIRAKVPRKARQVIVVSGKSRNSSESQAVFYQKENDSWRKKADWPTHNGFKGWTLDHHVGDLRSPVGVFSLTDAGGRLPNPGSKLPYDRSPAFTAPGSGFLGEPLAGSFDYVVAINYNRKTGTSPLDFTRPLGDAKGGGIWLHVDHGGPTHGCVSLKTTHMRELLLTLDPLQNPVIVMGDADSLQR